MTDPINLGSELVSNNQLVKTVRELADVTLLCGNKLDAPKGVHEQLLSGASESAVVN